MATSKYLEFGKSLAKLVEELGKSMNASETNVDKNVRLFKKTFMEKCSEVSQALDALLITPAAEDIAYLSTLIRFTAKFAVWSIKPDDRDRSAAAIADIREMEVCLQGYLKFKAESLTGDNAKLITLIEANLPK